MSLRTSYSDANIVIDEALQVTYSETIVQGSWSWTSANVSGTYYTARECHRYATKRFRYVGLTYAAAKACKAAMISLFTRTFKQSYWNGDVAQGQFDVDTGGEYVMADISCHHVDGDAWDVEVNVHEDDVRMKKVQEAYSPAVAFATERTRSYGSDGHGASAETETT